MSLICWLICTSDVADDEILLEVWDDISPLSDWDSDLTDFPLVEPCSNSLFGRFGPEVAHESCGGKSPGSGVGVFSELSDVSCISMTGSRLVVIKSCWVNGGFFCFCMINDLVSPISVLKIHLWCS